MSSRGPRKPPPPRPLNPPPLTTSTPPPSRKLPPVPPPRTTKPGTGIGSTGTVGTGITSSTTTTSIKNAPKPAKVPKAPPPPITAGSAQQLAKALLEEHRGTWEKSARVLFPDSATFESELEATVLNDIQGSSAPGEQVADAAAMVKKVVKEEGTPHIKDIYETKSGELVTAAIDAKAVDLSTGLYPSPDKKARAAISKVLKPDLPAVKSSIESGAKDGTTLTDLRTRILSKSGDFALGELKTREDKDTTLAAVVNDAFVDKLVLKHFTEPLTASTAFKLGAIKRWLRRDKDGKAYREDLKNVARDKASEEIHSDVNTKPNLSDTMKEFYEAKAQGVAYGDVKKFVDEVTLKKAEDIAKPIVSPYMGDVRTAARQALYAKVREGGHMFEWRKLQVAAAGGKAKIESLFETAKTAAHTQATQERSDPVKKRQVEQDITGKIDQSYASGIVKAVIESSHISKGWQVIAGIIDAAVPNIGGKAKLDLQLKIPVYKGVFITFQFVGEAERDAYMKKNRATGKKDMKDLLKSRVEFTTGVGYGMPGIFDAAAQFGGFLEAQGNDSTKLCMLMSYAMYRKMKDYTGLAPLAERIWGQGGTTRKIDKTTGKATGAKYTREEEAELWAAMVEEQAMGEKQAYADIGLLGKAKAVGNLGGVAKGEGELKVAGGTRYSGHMFSAGSKAGDTKGKTGKTSDQISGASAGQRLITVDLGGKIEVEGVRMAAELKGKVIVLEDAATKSLKFMGGEVEGEFQVQSMGGKEDTVVDMISKLGTSIATAATDIKGQIRGRATTAMQKVGTAARFGEDGVLAADGFAQAFDSSFTEGISKLPTIQDQVMGTAESILSLKSSLGINIKFSSYRKKLNPAATRFDKALDISVLSAKGLKIDLGVFAGEIEVKQRLGGYSTDGRFGVLGMGTM